MSPENSQLPYHRKPSSDAVKKPATVPLVAVLGLRRWSAMGIFQQRGIRMTASGHEDQFLPPKLSARSVIRKQTVAATLGNGRDAPISVISRTAIEPPESTQTGRYGRGQVGSSCILFS
jgi:hypothetical protein